VDIHTQQQIEQALAEISREVDRDDLTWADLKEVLAMLRNVVLFINPDRR